MKVAEPPPSRLIALMAPWLRRNSANSVKVTLWENEKVRMIIIKSMYLQGDLKKNGFKK